MARQDDDWKVPLRRAALSYPHPVAVAAAQVLRSRSPQATVDACLKAAETLVRYLAALSLASYRAREPAGESDGGLGVPLQGPLAFGTFLSIVQAAAALRCNHPAAKLLTPFRKKKDGQPGKADVSIVSLLQLRNRLGHKLAPQSDDRARAVLSTDQPHLKLAEAVASLRGALSCPLFVVEDQQMAQGRIRARLLWLMGESRDPEPMELGLQTDLYHLNTPYVACGEEVLRLWPSIIWDILAGHETHGLYIIDRVDEARVVCQSLDGKALELNGDAVKYFREVMHGARDDAEQVLVTDDMTLFQHWKIEMESLVAVASRSDGTMPWQEFDPDTINWYASRLEEGGSGTPQQIIARRLFDDRTRFFENEIFQARMLFGTEAVVRQYLQRDLLDIRRRSKDSKRWDERRTICANVLTSLRQAVDLFSSHIGLGDNSFDGLTKTEGTADYLAMREALVNLFIHQDYSDPSAPAQVELDHDRALFFNAGFSLVSEEQLVEGGRSQARNPVIARALRLIGFAELAGSGIRALQAAWRSERRRPPQFKSDRTANSYTLMLDWRVVEDRFDERWKDRLGVSVTAEHLSVLNLARAPEGVSLSEIASGTGLSHHDAVEATRYLVVQGLLNERSCRYHLRKDLEELLQ